MTKPKFIVGPPHFNWNFFLSNLNKICFSNDRFVPQKTKFEGQEEIENTFILCYFRESKDILVQVLFNNAPYLSNNSYAIYFWDKNNLSKSFCAEYPSHTIYPKVWDCRFTPGLMDFSNYLATQMMINRVLKQMGYEEFPLDVEKEKYCCNFVTKPLEEIESIAKQGGVFEILALKASHPNCDFDIELNCPWDENDK